MQLISEQKINRFKDGKIVNLVTFVIDTEDDVKNLSSEHLSGSTAIVVESGNVYILNCAGEWKVL